MKNSTKWVINFSAGKPLETALASFVSFVNGYGCGYESRAKVKEAMGFALDHADASADVVGVLKESLLVPETPIHGGFICGLEEGVDIASFLRGTYF